MLRKPLFWGIVFSLIGVLGWFVFVILSVITLGKFRDFANFFGIMAVASFPAALVWKLINKIWK